MRERGVTLGSGNALAEGADLFWKLAQRCPSVPALVLLQIFVGGGTVEPASHAQISYTGNFAAQAEEEKEGKWVWGFGGVVVVVVSALPRRVSDG